MIKRTIGIGTILFLILLFVIGVGIGIARGNTRVSELQRDDSHSVVLYHVVHVDRAGLAARVDHTVRLNSVERLQRVTRLEPVYLDDRRDGNDLVGEELRLTNLRHEGLRLRGLRSRVLRTVGSDLTPALGVERQGRLLSLNLRGVPVDGLRGAALSGGQLLRGGFRELDSLHLEV